MKRFGGNVALGGVDLEAVPGRVTALIGPNGSGKTTLLNVISGFLKPDEGTVPLGRPGHHRAEGPPGCRRRESRAPSRRRRSRRGSRSPRSVASARYPDAADLRDLRNADTCPEHAGRCAAIERWRFSCSSVMGIVQLADRPADELPLGTRRVLEVARALASNPSLLLLDEPASGLDEGEVDALAEVITRLRDAGATIVIVEHNFEMVMSISDRIDVLHLGTDDRRRNARERAQRPARHRELPGQGGTRSRDRRREGEDDRRARRDRPGRPGTAS